MRLWPRHKIQKPDPSEEERTSPYIDEYMAAVDRTEALGFEAPPRLLLRKECVDMKRVLPVLLDYYEQHSPEELAGQTLAIHSALIPRLYDRTGIHFNVTTGWIVRRGKPIFAHDESLINLFLQEGTSAWMQKGCPFHLWMTSLACEILDITFAMNLGDVHTREQCAQQVVYRTAYEPPGDLIYHPTLAGPDFFKKTGAVL